jgi:3,5-epimerase/4-reductase
MFNEESIPNFFGSSYSIVKGFTDQLMHNLSALNLRIRMPIHSCSNSRNFIDKILKYEKICSISNSMTVLDDFFPVFLDLILTKKTGTYNCTNPGTISHNQILELYREIIDPSFIWKNFTIEEQSYLLKSDRSNNALSTEKLNSYKVSNIYDSVRTIITNYK